MRFFKLAFAVLIIGVSSSRAHADEDVTPVSIHVVGSGHIRLVVADGVSKPCESSNNHVIFSKEVIAGDVINLVSASGSVCVDHTYGAFRDSQWAGPAVWSGARMFPTDAPLSGRISTDAP